MTPAQQPQRNPFTDLVYATGRWEIYRQDAGLGEKDYCVLRNGGFFCRTDDLNAAKNICAAIDKLRPHPPAPAPSERFTLHLLKISKKCDETKRILKTYQRGDLTDEEEDDAAELRGYRDALEWAHIPDYPLTIEQHDAAIRQDATLAAYEHITALLDDLRKYANGEYNEAALSDNEREMRIHLEYENRIWGIMKQLRQSTTTAAQERQP